MNCTADKECGNARPHPIPLPRGEGTATCSLGQFVRPSCHRRAVTAFSVALDKLTASKFIRDWQAFLPLLGGEGGRLTNSLLSLRCAVVFCFLLSFLPSAFATVGGAFDEGWRFFKGAATGAEQSSFDDSQWRTLDVPHDWSIEGPFAQTNKTGGAGAWLPHGVGWYRKSFSLSKEVAGKRCFIEFDGVMQNSEVWLNGVSLGKRPFGYVSFRYDLTPHLKYGPGQTNIIAVRADTSAQPASRWYSGAGIYRHVRLIPAEPIYVEPGSVFVTTPHVSPDSATVRAQAVVTNTSGRAEMITVRAIVSSKAKTGVAKSEEIKFTIPAGGSVVFDQELAVRKPELWSLEQPALYRVAVQVKRAKEMLDVEVVSFGIRTAEFKTDTGFWLNGKNLKLKGVCLHHDGSAFGAAVPLAVWERRLTNLRELGVNAIRTAHNPVAPEFLDLCDRMGFLVMNELFDCWTMKKNPYDYSLFFNEWSKTDLRDTIRRDRNHPSVILWSVGNEIKDTPKQELANRILKGLVEVCHENDPTRPVTQALFRPNTSGDYTNGLADLLDVIGTNYRDQELLDAWRAKPGRKIVGTEQGHERRTWLAARDNPQHAGQFLWVGVDYLGETKTWPRIAYPGGLLDRTGEIKPMAFERQSWWSDKPMVRMVRRVAPNDVLPEDPGWGGEERHTQVQFADWTPRSLEAHDENVEVYSNCDEVELFLNGKSLGTKSINKDASPRTWKVNFEPGILKAMAKGAPVSDPARLDKSLKHAGSETGAPVATDELPTAGKPARIILSTDRKTLGSTWDEVAFVRATVVDENGVVVPRANHLIRFSITGSGVIAAVDSADNASIEPFLASERRAYQGVCFALIKATQAGKKILVTAEAEGLQPGNVAIATPRK